MSEARESLRREQLRKLYLDQKLTLDTFLEHGAITPAQYEKSLGDLARKMGMEAPESRGEPE